MTARRDGYILLEATIAMIVISVGLVGVSRAFRTAGVASEHADRVRTATSLAEQRLAELRLAPPGTLGNREGAFAEPHAAFRWRTAVQPAERAAYDSVLVEVSWRESSGSRSLTLTSLIPAGK